MFYKYLQLPTILKVNHEVGSLDAILTDHNLYFQKKIVITTKHLYKLYKKHFKKIKRVKFKLLKSFDVSDIAQLEKLKKHKGSLIIGFGGGKVLDYAKYFASSNSYPFFSMPSTLSNDGIYSPVAILKKNGKRISVGINPPIGVLVDFSIIKQSPKINLLAGIGDLVSNVSALDDWKLAHEQMGEPINDFSYTLSHMAAYSVLHSNTTEIFDEKFLKKLSYGLIISGLAMSIAGSSRPASGAEHQISHAIDHLYPKRVTHHGIQVAYGCLLIEERFRNKRHKLYKDFFDNIGLTKAIKEEINFTPKETDNIIKAADTIRNRFTILSLHSKT